MESAEEVTKKLQEEGITEEIEVSEEKAEVEEPSSQQEEQEEVLTEFEQEQKVKGWNPDGPKSAEEWARAEPLYDELKLRGKEIKQLKRTLDELKGHMDKQKQAAYDQAMKDLTRQRDQAIAEGDVNMVNMIDEEARGLELDRPVDIPQAFQEFQLNNEEWLTDTSFEAMEMQRFATERDKQLIGKEITPEEHVALLEEHMHKKFPEYFNPGSTSVGQGMSVESGSANSSATQSKKKYQFKDLTSEQKQIARDFEKMNVMKTSEYIKQLVDNGDLE